MVRIKSIIGGQQEMFRHLRDEQNLVACTEEDCICNYFDHVIDAMEDLGNELEKRRWK